LIGKIVEYSIAKLLPLEHGNHKDERDDNDDRADADDDDVMENIVETIGGDVCGDIMTVQPVRNGWRRRRITKNVFCA
jgi:hypothetical protein